MPELARAPQVVASHPDVAECCVVGASDALKGQLPLGLIVLRKSATSEPKDVEAQVGPTPKSLREGGAHLAHIATAPPLSPVPSLSWPKLMVRHAVHVENRPRHPATALPTLHHYQKATRSRAHHRNVLHEKERMFVPCTPGTPISLPSPPPNQCDPRLPPAIPLSCSLRSCRWSASTWALWQPSSTPSPSRRCQRRAAARSCADCCYK